MLSVTEPTEKNCMRVGKEGIYAKGMKIIKEKCRIIFFNIMINYGI